MSFQTKYKDRAPQNTVKIIEDFFTGRGYTVKVAEDFECESGTWTCGINLLWGDKQILNSNGKGMSKAYSLASGYSELYERYCNRMFYGMTPFISNRVMQETYNNTKHYFCPKEKLLSYDDAYKIPRFKQFLDETGGDFSRPFFDTITEGKYVSVPFKGFTQDDEVYLPLAILNRVVGSTGMASGNNVEEALVQAISEVFEHHVSGEHYTKTHDAYYAINLDSITNPNLKKLIKKVKDCGNDVYLLDYSYIYGLPVVASLIVNHKTDMISMNFGSAPVFDIAVERVFTELYQGRKNMDEIKTQLLSPYRRYHFLDAEYTFGGNVTMSPTVPEEIILNLQYVDKPNPDAFLFGEEYSNRDLLEFYKDICKQKGISLRYYDFSLTGNMSAVQVYADNLEGFYLHRSCGQLLTKEERAFLYNSLIQMYHIVDNYVIKHGEIAWEVLYNIITELELQRPLVIWLWGMLEGNEWYAPYEDMAYHGIRALSTLLVSKPLDTYDIPDGAKPRHVLYRQSKKYLTLYRYVKTEKYTKEELKKLFDFLGEEITDENIENILNPFYLVGKIILEPYSKEYQSDDFNAYIQSLVR